MEGSIQAAASNDIANQYIELETSMIEELDRLPLMSPSRCIFRVPDRLRRVCEEAYTPRVISIGPLHHGKQTLKVMEEHKKRYLKYFLDRTNNLSLKDYIKIIKDKEARLRSCYSETIELESDEFVRIILVDAIFMIEFLFRDWYPTLLDENDCFFGKSQMVCDVRNDLLMLENQLPFFILEDLFDPDIFSVHLKYSNRLNGVESLSILFLSHNYLNNFSTFWEKLDYLDTTYSSQVEGQHFVDHLRKLLIGPILKNEESARQSKCTAAPSIEELHLAGVKFKVGSTNNLFDIRFKDGILEIPKLTTWDSTELVLRNLVAFEQCSCEGNYLSDYVSIMDEFVDSPKDVKLLVAYNIVQNNLAGGDNKLCTMINRLSTGVIYYPNNFFYGTLCEELNNFCNSKWNKSMANLRHNYFNTPWATISFVAALLLIILTVIQTICSIISLS